MQDRPAELLTPRHLVAEHELARVSEVKPQAAFCRLVARVADAAQRVDDEDIFRSGTHPLTCLATQGMREDSFIPNKIALSRLDSGNQQPSLFQTSSNVRIAKTGPIQEAHRSAVTDGDIQQVVTDPGCLLVYRRVVPPQLGAEEQ